MSIAFNLSLDIIEREDTDKLLAAENMLGRLQKTSDRLVEILQEMRAAPEDNELLQAQYLKAKKIVKIDHDELNRIKKMKKSTDKGKAVCETAAIHEVTGAYKAVDLVFRKIKGAQQGERQGCMWGG